MCTRNTINRAKSKPDERRQDNGLLLHWLEASTERVIKSSIGHHLEKGHPNRLDVYFVGWFIIQVAVLVTLALIPINGATKLALIGVFSYRLFEISISMFDSVFISVMLKRRHRSVPRLFSLVLVNYVEVVLIFGIMFNLLMQPSPILSSLNISVSLATLSGITIDTRDNSVFAASISEMLLGVFFLTGVIAAIANYLGTKE